jgi:septal ring factor EnvC (AmiA/AmiB activator)
MNEQNDIQLQAQETLTKASQIHWLRSIGVFLLLIIIGIGVSLITSYLKWGDFALNFLTEMIGAAVTFVLIEVAFRLLENNTERRYKQALELANAGQQQAEERAERTIKAAEESASKATEAVQQSQLELQKVNKYLDELNSNYQKLQDEYQDVLTQAESDRKALFQIQMQEFQRMMPSIISSLEQISPEFQQQQSMKRLGNVLDDLRRFSSNYYGTLSDVENQTDNPEE